MPCGLFAAAATALLCCGLWICGYADMRTCAAIAGIAAIRYAVYNGGIEEAANFMLFCLFLYTFLAFGIYAMPVLASNKF
jgi:hypothetical protein